MTAHAGAAAARDSQMPMRMKVASVILL